MLSKWKAMQGDWQMRFMVEFLAPISCLFVCLFCLVCFVFVCLFVCLFVCVQDRKTDVRQCGEQTAVESKMDEGGNAN